MFESKNTLYNFFNYLMKYLEISSGVSAGQLLESKSSDAHTVKHLPPFHFRFRTKSINFLAPWDPGHAFVETVARRVQPVQARAHAASPREVALLVVAPATH